MTLALAGCVARTSVAPRPLDIRGHLPDLHFRLIDDTGRLVDATAFRGQTTLVYFGYSGCGAECPVTLARLAEMTRRAQATRVLFVTVTPEIDRPAVLRAYLSHFDPAHMTGLTGRTTEARQLARDLRAAWPQPGGTSHGDLVYVFDGQGRARFLIAPDDADSDIVRALQQVAHD